MGRRLGPAAVARCALSGEAFRTLARVACFISSTTLTNAMNRISTLLVAPVRRSLWDVRNFLTCFSLSLTAPTGWTGSDLIGWQHAGALVVQRGKGSARFPMPRR